MHKTVFHLTHRIGVPLVLLFTILSALCVVVSLPFVWHPIYHSSMEENLMQHKLGELYLSDSLQISDGLWSRKSWSDISSSLKAYHLNGKEIYHFEDVRGLLRKALVFVVGGLGFLLALYRFMNWRTIWASALIMYGIAGAIFGAWSMIAWRHMFRTLHWWIFRDDSWIMPRGSYSLFLYPHSVWQTIGTLVLFSLLVVLVAALACLTRKRAKL